MRLNQKPTTPPEPLPDSTQASPERTSPTSSSSSYCSLALRNIRNSWGVYFRSDDAAHPGRRCVLLLCFVCFLLTVAVNFSKPGVETVFRLGELCWNAVKETEFDSGWLVQHWLFILVALHVLQGRLKARNVSVALVGCVSALLAPLIFSMATLPGISGTLANTLVFVSAGSGTLARALIPMLRAMSSAVVSLDEQGALFASYACVELAGAAVFDLAASQVYKATVHLWKGIIFVIMTFFFVVVLILLIILSVLQRRWEQKAAEDTERRSAPSQGTGSPE
ncbi:proton-coupled folate transporter-like [Babylonia areolata]|uniref:proton-coupled folate transporter-like n=1 Tax=Babylonia areolata TaxID=304850 RepID=UPI003FD00AA2